MTFLSPRPTTYKGIKMRSRLEARYAALFDERRFSWTYEPGCFANQEGQYLPDFELHDIDVAHAFTPGWVDPFLGARVRSVYVEVKPPDHALAEVCRRMEIILDSDADSGLLLLSEVYDGDHPAGSDGLVLLPSIGGQSMWLQAWLHEREPPRAGLLVVGLWTYFRISGFRLPDVEDPGCAA
jgi:hypothetical protein